MTGYQAHYLKSTKTLSIFLNGINISSQIRDERKVPGRLVVKDKTCRVELSVAECDSLITPLPQKKGFTSLASIYIPSGLSSEVTATLAYAAVHRKAVFLSYDEKRIHKNRVVWLRSDVNGHIRYSQSKPKGGCLGLLFTYTEGLIHAGLLNQ